MTVAPLTKASFEGGGFRVRCFVEFRGELNRGEIEKRAGFAVGQIRGAVVNECEGGTARFNFARPWTLRYDSIEGMLPNEWNQLLLLMDPLDVTVEILGIRCRFVGQSGATIFLELIEGEDGRGRPALYETGSVFTGLTQLNGRENPIFCPARGNMGGGFLLTRQEILRT